MTEIPSKTFGRLAPRVTALLVGSIVAGLAYNQVSPLGVRLNPSAARVSWSGAQSERTSIYSNELISLRLEGMHFGTTHVNPGTSEGAVPSLEWPQTKALLAAGKIVLIDARASAYYQAAHIPGAVSLPAVSEPEVVASFVRGYPTNSAMVVYCSNPTCPLADLLAKKLIRQHGFSNVKVMPGGFTEYSLYEAAGARR